MATHSSILAWRIPWKRSLLGYSPWGCKELETTEWLTHNGIGYMHILMPSNSSLTPTGVQKVAAIPVRASDGKWGSGWNCPWASHSSLPSCHTGPTQVPAPFQPPASPWEDFKMLLGDGWWSPSGSDLPGKAHGSTKWREASVGMGRRPRAGRGQRHDLGEDPAYIPAPWPVSGTWKMRHRELKQHWEIIQQVRCRAGSGVLCFIPKLGFVFLGSFEWGSEGRQCCGWR